MHNYTLKEMMAIVAAREIKNKDIVFCGTGISMLAAMAAKNINAPESVIFFETGAIDSQLEELPLAVSDPRVMYHTSANGCLADSFAVMQNPVTGKHVIGILGAVQIDKFGNLNTTVIGDYFSPEIRFSGSGGGCDVASFVPRSIIFMQHEKKKFVKKLDYLTSPGYLYGNSDGNLSEDTDSPCLKPEFKSDSKFAPGSCPRKKAGLPEGGPIMVISNLGVMRFDEHTKEMYLAGIYPGITVRQILENMEFDMDVSGAQEVPPPSEYELKLMREQCDPQRLILA